MVNVYTKDSKILLVAGKVATSINCCCSSSPPCSNKTCSDLPHSFSTNIIFQNYLTQYSPKNLTFTYSGGIWGANGTATAAGCPNIDIAFTIYCDLVPGQPSLLAYALTLTSDSFGVDNMVPDIVITTDTGESLGSDASCNLIIPTFYINFITPLTFLGDLFLNTQIGAGCNS